MSTVLYCCKKCGVMMNLSVLSKDIKVKKDRTIDYGEGSADIYCQVCATPINKDAFWSHI